MSEPLPLPVIRRARGYRLYDAQGRRYLDAWQGGGRSLLGHRPARQTALLKAVLSKGLTADLPSVYARRLERALLQLLPGCAQVRLTACMPAALALAGRYLGRAVSADEVVDPALAEDGWEGRAQIALWRPGLQAPAAFERPPAGLSVLLPVLPFGPGGVPAAVCFRGELPAGFPPSEIVSPLLLAGALRSLHDLRRLQPPAWLAEGLLDGLPGWRRRGVYLAPRCPAEGYAELFRSFLEGGVLLSPSFPGPSILPQGELSRGELQRMVGLFRRFPGE